MKLTFFILALGLLVSLQMSTSLKAAQSVITLADAPASDPGDMIIGDYVYFCMYNRAEDSLEIRKWDDVSLKVLVSVPQAKLCKFVKSGEKVYMAYEKKVDGTAYNQIFIDEFKDETLTAVAKSEKFNMPIQAINDYAHIIIHQGNIAIPVRFTVDVAAGTNTYGLLTSEDMGASWKLNEVQDEGKPVRINSIVVDKEGSWILSGLSAKGATLFKSLDKGLNWTKIHQDPNGTFIRVFKSDGPYIVALQHQVENGARDCDLLISKDGGATFVKKEIPQIEPGLSENYFYALYNEGTKSFTIAGGQWVDKNNQHLIYALYTSFDEGDTWLNNDSYMGPDVTGRLADLHALEIDENGYVYTVGHEVRENDAVATVFRRAEISQGN